MFDKIKRSTVDTYGMAGLMDETTAYLQHKHDLINELADRIVGGQTYSIRFDNRVETLPFDGERVCTTRLKADIIPECLSINIKKARQTYLPWPSHVIFHPPATVVFWDDDTKTVVKCMEDEEFNPEVGLAMCFCKKVMGDGYKRWFTDALKKGRWQNEKATKRVEDENSCESVEQTERRIEEKAREYGDVHRAVREALKEAINKKMGVEEPEE